MARRAKELLNVLDEMSGLNQVVVLDSNCSGVLPYLQKITSGTKVKTVAQLTGRSNSPDLEIHQALQDLGIQLLVFVTKNCKHFDGVHMRSVAKYFMICLLEERAFDEVLARHLVTALRYDSDLKAARSPGNYPIVYFNYKYLERMKKLIKRR